MKVNSQVACALVAGQQQQPQAASYSHNPFRAALSQLRDADELEKELEGSAGEPQGVQGLQSPGMQRKELLRQSPELVSFAGLYGALSQGTMTEAKVKLHSLSSNAMSKALGRLYNMFCLV